MTCPNCGSENTPGAKFCFRCGASLAVAAPAAPGEPAPESVQTPSPAYSEPNAPADGMAADQAPQPSYSQPASAPSGWQAGSAPQAAPFTLPSAPPWLQHFTQQISASGVAFRGFTSAMKGITTPLAPMGKLIPAAVGAIVLIVGTFLPSASEAGFSFDFWTVTKATTFVVVVLVILGVIMAVYQQYAWLWITWGLSFLLILLGFLNQLFTSGGIGPSWGWIFVWLGNIILFIAAAIPESSHTWISQRVGQQPPGAQP